MLLPEHILQCIRRLETAGFCAYAVGGCVRDALLGLEPHDYDLCTDALPEQTQAVFADLPLILDGLEHGTVKVVMPEETVEITTFRKEGPYSDNRHPDWVAFVKDIREDLARRDFTVNAIAYSPTLGYADPFGGRADLQNGILRTVGDGERRFREDALRILRGIRFASRFRLTPEESTLAAMEHRKQGLESLSRERMFDELSRFLCTARVDDLLVFAPILGTAIPELGEQIGFDQCSPHHAFDLYTHTAWVLHNTDTALPLRWAALLHDIGKVPTFRKDETGRGHFKNHAAVGAELADGILRRLRAPVPLREEAVWLIANHMARLTPDRGSLRRLVGRYGDEWLVHLLNLQQADMRSKGMNEPDSTPYSAILREIEGIRQRNDCLSIRQLAVNGSDLQVLGITGKHIGTCLTHLLEQVMDDKLENTRAALLEAAARRENQ